MDCIIQAAAGLAGMQNGGPWMSAAADGQARQRLTAEQGLTAEHRRRATALAAGHASAASALAQGSVCQSIIARAQTQIIYAAHGAGGADVGKVHDNGAIPTGRQGAGQDARAAVR